MSGIRLILIAQHCPDRGRKMKKIASFFQKGWAVSSKNSSSRFFWISHLPLVPQPTRCRRSSTGPRRTPARMQLGLHVLSAECSFNGPWAAHGGPCTTRYACVQISQSPKGSKLDRVGRKPICRLPCAISVQPFDQWSRVMVGSSKTHFDRSGNQE